MPLYKALKACIAGGRYRKAGEVFEYHYSKAPPHVRLVESAYEDSPDGAEPVIKDEFGVVKTLDQGMDHPGIETLEALVGDVPDSVDGNTKVKVKNYKFLGGKKK
jgi:hypothetical protein